MDITFLAFKSRFETKFRVTPGCWPWLAGKFANGYGCILYQGKYRKAHRVAYTLYVGSFPDHLEIMHSCDNPACVNPSHLIAGTHANNMADMSHKGRSAHGQRSGASKLTTAEIWQIRELFASGLFTQQEIGSWYGVGNQAVSRYVKFTRQSRELNPYAKEK